MSDEPPCEECPKADLSERNKLAWQIWSMLNEFERQRQVGMNGMFVQSIPLSTMLDVGHAYGADERDVEKVQLIERKMLPWIREREKPKQSKGQ